MPLPDPLRPEPTATEPRASSVHGEPGSPNPQASGDGGVRRGLDAAALARTRSRLQRAAQAPWLHGEVARRMAQRLPLIRLQPQCIVEWGAFLGASAQVLEAAYPHARRLAVEPDAQRVAQTAKALQMPWWSPRRWSGHGARALLAAQVPPDCAQLLWSNMGLHGSLDPRADLAAWHRVLQVDGFLMFSTLGPGSLGGLRALYSTLGWPVPMAPLVDMHDLGDMLVEAGFADPVMDQETITLTWATPSALLSELRQLGGNVDPRRAAGLRTPRWRAELESQLAARAAPDGRIALEFELVYGHAFRVAPRPKVAARTELALDDMRAMVRGSRRRG